MTPLPLTFYDNRLLFGRAAIPILVTLGVILIVIGVVLELLGMAGHAVGGRRHYY